MARQQHHNKLHRERAESSTLTKGNAPSAREQNPHADLTASSTAPPSRPPRTASSTDGVALLITDGLQKTLEKSRGRHAQRRNS